MIRLKPSVWRMLGGLFLATYALQGIAIARGGEASPEFPMWVGAAMFLPALFTFLHLRRSGESLRSLPWRLGPWRDLLLGATLPACLVLLGLAIFEGTGFGFQPSIDIDDANRLSTELPLLLSGKSMTRPFFALNLLLSGIVFSLVTGLMTLGEEIGWRGFLQGQLLERNRLLPSVVFLGLIWAAWHLPLLLAGFNYPNSPVLGALVYFPIAAIGVSGW